MKSRLSFKILGITVLIFLAQVSFLRCAHALISPHPLEIYERGMRLVNSYQGDPADLQQAQQCFTELMNKFPDSPYGYLGMSQVQKINAYLYGNRYRMSKIRDEVLPMAVKALELGPSIREVHEHYSAIEAIYEDFYANQKEAQEALISFPERPETYLLIGMFFGDQDESEKAIEFYKMALGMQPSADLRLKILERIGLLYLNELQKPDMALGYFRQAAELDPDSAVSNENLGMVYLNLKDYAKAVEHLTKAVHSLNNAYTQNQLAQAKALLAEQEKKETIGLLKDDPESNYPKLSQAK
jgi:tetratricopeptide (TPR) repeat protein